MAAARKKKPRKIRVAFHKNRNRRARGPDLTRQSLEDLEAVEDLESGERVTGKGAVSRYRTIVASDESDGEIIREIDTQACQSGRVLSAIGANQCRVQASDGQIYTCSVRRLLRTLAREGRSAVVAGDRVLFTTDDESTGDESTGGVIERVEPRSTALSRISRNKAHVIVANVDQAVIVASMAEPQLKPGLIDRFLCSAEKGGIRGIVCINKIDLSSPRLIQPVIGQYSRLGYPVLLTNALTGEGIPQLRSLLAGQETVFAGQSGVGKSSLLNAIQPGLGLSTGTVSTDTSKGKHTTRVTQLLQLQSGGWVVDTPGIRTLQLWDIPKEEVEGLFIEFRPFVALCRFPSCAHLHEDGCRVKMAVEQGQISPIRYQNFLRIYTGDDSWTRETNREN